ncbi:MAG: transglycosylase SLT domain-containing protein [Deltaproteobacteria bacterium]|nr:transglycosylase SLT domain-containing protein [Deltaproteobacteria bacterium]
MNPQRAFVTLWQMRNHGFITVVLLAILLAASPACILAQETDFRQSFAAAYSLFSSGAPSQAKDPFQRTLSSGYALADYALYYLAVIAFQESDWQASREFISRLREEYPRSIWYHRAELQRIKIEIAEKSYPEAVNALRSLRAEKNLKHDISEEALYLQAQTQEAQGDVFQAYSLFQELRTIAPRSRWSAAARREVVRLRDQHPDLFGLITVTAIADEADRLVREREHGAAEILYKKLLNQDLGPVLRLQHLTKLANLYLSIRKRSEAIPVLEEIIRDFSSSSEAADALYRIGNILWNRNDNSQALAYFMQLKENYPDSQYSASAQFAAADILESQGKNNEAIPLYSSLPKKFPNSQVGEDAMWRLAWLHYRSGNLLDANATFGSLAIKTKQERYKIAALYWQARTSEQLGIHDTAIRLYQQIFRQGQESYYQALAARALARAGISTPQTKAIKPAAVTDQDLLSYPEASFHLVRARELAELKLPALAVSELDEVNRIARQHPRLRWLLVEEYANNHAFSRSVAVANQLPGPASDRVFHRFPLAYWELIQQKSRERDIDPYLILALIRQESLFDTRARSPAVALGLMQLLPSTAGRMARQLGQAAPANEKLFNAELNLTLGIQYLSDLLRRYSNNRFKAIAAYNAGEAAVDRWEKEILTDDIEEFVEQIPYLETRQYVKLVMRNHGIYKSLYDQNQ